MLVVRSNSLKNWLWLTLGLVAVTLVLFFATVTNAEAQSSARLSLIQSDTSRIVLELEVSGYDARTVIVGGATYTQYSIGDLGDTDEPGKPQLPVKGAMVGIPPGAQATLRIVTDQSQTSSVPRHPVPVSTKRAQIDPRRTLPTSVTEVYTPNPSTYSANQLYPAAAAKIGTSGDWRNQHYTTVQFYPLQYNPVTRQLVLHRRLRVEIALSYPRGQSPAAIGSPSNEGAFERVMQDAVINYSSARNWRTPKPAVPRARTASPRAAGEWFKIGTNADGIYKVTCGQLAAARGGMATITPSTLRLYKQVYTTPVESAIRVVDAGGWGSCNSNDSANYVEFFGLGATGKYTDTNVYWLTDGGAAGKRMLLRDGTGGGGSAATPFTKTVHLEQNLLYRPSIPMTEDADHWYGTLFYYPDPYGPSTNEADYTFPIDNLASGVLSASLQIDMQGFTSGNHQTIISINGTQIYSTTWTGPGEHLATIPFDQSLLLQSTNTIHINEPTSLSGAAAFLNYLNITYRGAYSTSTNLLRFQQPASGNWYYQIGGYITSTIETFDITDPYNVQMITPTTVTGSGPYTLQFTDTITSPHEYLALATTQWKSPTSVVLDTSSTLREPNNGADYIIIAASPFLADPPTKNKLDPNVPGSLGAVRATQFSRVKLIDVQDVYDEFNDGVVDPQAIHGFLDYARLYWQDPDPAYLLLVGAGNFDPKDYCRNICNPGTNNEYYVTENNATLIPPYLRMVDPIIGETVTDNCLAVFSGTCGLDSHPIASMFIGRLPATKTSDVNALVQKILNYENPPAGIWRSTSAFVADNAFNQFGGLDSAGNFFDSSEHIAGNPTLYPGGLQKDRIYYNPCTDTESYPQCYLPFPSYSTPTAAHDAFISSINQGRVLVNYIGHGDVIYWADEHIFDWYNNDLDLLTNGAKTPVMLELTCKTGYFIYAHPLTQSFAKQNVNLSPDLSHPLRNGAVASWAATGYGLVSGHDLLEEGFFNAVMNQSIRALGPAIAAGKSRLVSGGGSTDLIDTTLLLGDPASRLTLQFTYDLPLILR